MIPHGPRVHVPPVEKEVWVLQYSTESKGWFRFSLLRRSDLTLEAQNRVIESYQRAYPGQRFAVGTYKITTAVTDFNEFREN